MYKYSYYYLLFLIFPICVLPQRNDSLKTYQLKDIVISATRTENPITELANSITIIDSAEISRRNKASVFDLLKDEYGITFTQQGGTNKYSSIYIRGANTNHTMVLIDGVEANMTSDPGNSYDFSFLTPDNIQSIEVLRGPQSTLYGSDAMAGVINIITRKGEGVPKFSLSGEGGAYGTYRGTAGVNGAQDIFNYSISLSRFKTLGFSSASTRYGNKERDEINNSNVSSRFGLDFSNNLSFNLFYRFSKGSSDYDQWGGLHGDDPTYVFNMEEGSYRGEAALSLFDGIWKQTLGASFFRNLRRYSFDSTTYNTYSSRSFYDGRKVKFDWQNNVQITNWNLFTLGLESVNEEANSEYYYGSSLSLFPDNKTYTTGLYLQDEIKVQDNFFSTIGIRVDNHNLFGTVTTFRIAPAYLISSTGTKIKFTYGTAFHSPSLFDLYDPAYGNLLLKPEKNKGWDAGIEQYYNNNNFSLGITYFNNQFVDLFGYDNNFKTINIDKAETYGIEFFSKAAVSSKAKLKFNYTYTKAIALSGTDEGLPLLRRPDVKIDFVLYYTFDERLNATAELTFINDRDNINFSSFPYVRIKLPSYEIINLAASYTLASFLDIYGRIDNLFNTNYEEIYGYGTPGLSGYLGFKLNL